MRISFIGDDDAVLPAISPSDLYGPGLPETISLMADQEQLLLTERTANSHNRLLTSISTEFFLIPISVLCLIVLFALLLRDAIARQRAGQAAERINGELARTVNALEETARESDLLTAARNELQLCVEVEQVYSTAATSFSRLLPQTSGCLYMINNSRNHVEDVSFWGNPVHEDFNQPESCCALRSGQPRWRQPGVSEIHCAHFAGTPPERYHCRPIVAYGNTIGFLYLPVSLKANWMLRVTQLRPTTQYTAATRRTLELFGVLPVLAASAALAYHFRPLTYAYRHIAFLFIFGCILVELCLIRFDKVPFTCSFVPGKANIQVVFWGGAFAFMMLSLLFGIYELKALGRTSSFIILMACSTTIAIALWIMNRIRAHTAVLYYDEALPEVITRLGLTFFPTSALPHNQNGESV